MEGKVGLCGEAFAFAIDGVGGLRTNPREIGGEKFRGNVWELRNHHSIWCR
jgi:hypothetical protein